MKVMLCFILLLLFCVFGCAVLHHFFGHSTYIFWRSCILPIFYIIFTFVVFFRESKTPKSKAITFLFAFTCFMLFPFLLSYFYCFYLIPLKNIFHFCTFIRFSFPLLEKSQRNQFDNSDIFSVPGIA